MGCVCVCICSRLRGVEGRSEKHMAGLSVGLEEGRGGGCFGLGVGGIEKGFLEEVVCGPGLGGWLQLQKVTLVGRHGRPREWPRNTGTTRGRSAVLSRGPSRLPSGGRSHRRSRRPVPVAGTASTQLQQTIALQGPVPGSSGYCFPAGARYLGFYVKCSDFNG